MENSDGMHMNLEFLGLTSVMAMMCGGSRSLSILLFEVDWAWGPARHVSATSGGSELWWAKGELARSECLHALGVVYLSDMNLFSPSE